jgi:hypothetical protein
MAASVHTAAFWDAAPCSPVDTGVRFADAYCLVVLMIEAVYSTKASATFYLEPCQYRVSYILNKLDCMNLYVHHR